MNDADNNLPVRRTDEKRRNEKVVRGNVKTKHKFSDVFLAEDVSNVKTYLFMDVLIPAAKKLLMDIVTNGLGMLLGDNSSRKGGNTNASYVSYRNYGDHRDDYRPDYSRSRSRYNYNDIIFETRFDAEEVLMRMEEAIKKYRMVSVLDLYDFAGLPSTPSDNKYGWVSLRNAEIRRAGGGGYMIELPKALPLD
jgi:hypothetical protein